MVVTLSQQSQIWNLVIENLKKRCTDKHLFDTFYATTKLIKVDGKKMQILTNSKISQNALTSNPRISTILTDAIKEVTETDYEIEIVIKEDLEKGKESETVVSTERTQFFPNCKLNPKYTFDNFVVGKCNQEAVQASILITESPGVTFNPLFLYSKPGLGKTHLLHAIGNHIKEKKPYAKVLYISTDAFIDEFIKYVHGEQQENLKEFMKSVDVLLVDDIQSLADKKKTMEMFFFIFNALVQNNKQIVLTTDRHPNDKKGLEERIESRFNMGLSINLSNPDTDTLLTILKNKIEANGLDITNFSPDGLKFLAENFSKNVRELEGALNRLIFYTITMKKMTKIDLETVVESVKPMINTKSGIKEINEEKVVQVVANYYNLTDSQIKSKSRISQIALARQIAMYLCRSICGTSYAQIGKLFNRDHSTVMTAVEKVGNMLKTDQQLSTAIQEIRKDMRN